MTAEGVLITALAGSHGSVGTDPAITGDPYQLQGDRKLIDESEIHLVPAIR